MRDTSDAFGNALLDWVHGGTEPEIIERDDGVIEIGAGPEVYLMDFDEWPSAEQASFQYVRGRVADVGCGGGRAARHLQERGCDVVGIDSSPLAIKAAQLHGVQKTRINTVDRLVNSVHEFDTLILFGNNLGVFGTPQRARRILMSWAKKLPPGARVLIESTNPSSNGVPVIDREYCRRNREKGRAIGQCRLRVWYDRSPSEWFSWFFASQTELKKLMRGTGWTLHTLLSGSPDEPYVAVFEIK
ncbi:MAG: methyltransferase domain-containing protein [Acidimicrobiales bacterium]